MLAGIISPHVLKCITCIPFNITLMKMQFKCYQNVMGWLTRWKCLSYQHHTPAYYLFGWLDLYYSVKTEFSSSIWFWLSTDLYLISYIACADVAAACIAAMNGCVFTFKRDFFLLSFRLFMLRAIELWIKSWYRRKLLPLIAKSHFYHVVIKVTNIKILYFDIVGWFVI